jgi:hypothetical protein
MICEFFFFVLFWFVGIETITLTFWDDACKLPDTWHEERTVLLLQDVYCKTFREKINGKK